MIQTTNSNDTPPPGFARASTIARKCADLHRQFAAARQGAAEATTAVVALTARSTSPADPAFVARLTSTQDRCRALAAGAARAVEDLDVIKLGLQSDLAVMQATMTMISRAAVPALSPAPMSGPAINVAAVKSSATAALSAIDHALSAGASFEKIAHAFDSLTVAQLVIERAVGTTPQPTPIQDAD